MSRVKKGLGFFGEVKAELKKVTWSTRAQTMKYTGIILGFVAVMSVFLGGLDYIFTYLASLIL